MGQELVFCPGFEASAWAGPNYLNLNNLNLKVAVSVAFIRLNSLNLKVAE